MSEFCKRIDREFQNLLGERFYFEPNYVNILLIDPAVMGPPSVFLASDAAYGINGQRVIAKEWKDSLRSKGIELPFES